MNAELARDLLLDATASIEALARAATAAQTQVTANARQTAAQLQKLIDPRQEGRHPDEVNGQPAKQSDGSVIERFAEPAIVLESPDAVALTSRQSLNAYAGARLHGTAQHDLHLAAGAAFAGVSGDGASLYTAAGGFRAIAQHGPVSLEAHTAPLQILADQSLTVTSTTDRVEILAKDQIVLQCGESRITLKDGDITFATPGAFVVKAGQHLFQGAKSQAAALPHLPTSRITPLPTDLQFRYSYHDGEPVQGAEYLVTMDDGTTYRGTLDAQGGLSISSVPAGGADITVGADTRPYQQFRLPLKPDDESQQWLQSSLS